MFYYSSDEYSLFTSHLKELWDCWGGHRQDANLQPKRKKANQEDQSALLRNWMQIVSATYYPSSTYFAWFEEDLICTGHYINEVAGKSYQENPSIAVVLPHPATSSCILSLLQWAFVFNPSFSHYTICYMEKAFH